MFKFGKKAVLGASVAISLATGIIAGFEGRRLIAYKDPVGIPTICDGITEGVKMGDTATPEECDKKLEIEILKIDQTLLREIKPEVIATMPDTRKAAIISFVYNVGRNAFKKSTLLRKLNAGDWQGACREMPRWVYAKGQKLRGLEFRRASEMELCLRQ